MAGSKARSRARSFRSRTKTTNSLPEKHDFMRGKRRFKSDLVPASILVDRYFTAERDTIAKLNPKLPTSTSSLMENARTREARKGCLRRWLRAKATSRKITAKAVKGPPQGDGKDPDYADESAALEEYADLLEKKDKVKAS